MATYLRSDSQIDFFHEGRLSDFSEVLPEAKLEWLNYRTLIILSKTFLLTNLTFLLKLNLIDTHQSTDKI